MTDDIRIIAATVVIMIVLATWVAVTISEPEPEPDRTSETRDAARLDAELAIIAQALRAAGIETCDLILARRLRELATIARAFRDAGVETRDLMPARRLRGGGDGMTYASDSTRGDNTSDLYLRCPRCGTYMTVAAALDMGWHIDVPIRSQLCPSCDAIVEPEA